MNNRKMELKKLKKYELHSSWYLILILTAIFATWLLVIYIVSIFQNKYLENDDLGLTNDIVVSIITGLISGILMILFAFIFLDLVKRSFIKDYFSYYSYLNALRNKTKYTFFKDSKIPKDLYAKNAKQMTKMEFISIVAGILNYSIMSPHYKNLVNEIDSDFALHSFLTPNFNKLRKIAISKIIIFDLLIPISIQSLLLSIIILINNRSIMLTSSISHNSEDISISAITRILIILLTTIFSLMISISIYEFYILNKIKNYNSFNDFYFLSFNNYDFKKLNSSLIKR
ncbi:hypothetical protein [Metamycoplasma auris]|uniref:Uncharacterized protein n=1 Tax=Metamycoplasma auris TaxID=51363 RepID=A0A2W7G1S5_9BACT|nr:hypothetical protein [Metamycoplasma auris]PZV99893.1 hypothetical protein BCF89_10521 [Metamycoplasma auris]